MNELKWKDKVIEGSTFPDAPYNYGVKISLNSEIRNEYLPALARVLPTGNKGLKLLITAMTHKEGFKKGTRSYKTNNPGNIGNTDIGVNKTIENLEEGIKLQIKHIQDIASGKKKAYPLGKPVVIKPYFSPEIHKNRATYGMSGYLPGYKFTFTGQLDQFIKIYATGARGGNSYLNTIISYFKMNGVSITPETTLQQILVIQ